jgi:xanthine dehydrogenase accessory factor
MAGERPIPATGRAVNLFEVVSAETSAGRPVAVATAVAVLRGQPPCRLGQKLVVGPAGPLAGGLGCAEFDTLALAGARAALESGHPAQIELRHDLGTIAVFVEPVLPARYLVLLGATPLAEILARLATEVGYRVVLVEPRADRPRGSGPFEQVVTHPSELGPLGGFDAVHTDHDCPGLADHVAYLIRAGASYVGVVGSLRHTAAELGKLAELGLDPDQMAIVNSPAGLDIGSREPAEIAVSILAGLIAARHGRSGRWLTDPGGSFRPD